MPESLTEACPVCGATWQRLPGKAGRPRVYCSADCKRFVTIAQRVLSRRAANERAAA